jgi:hypothetical protein
MVAPSAWAQVGVNIVGNTAYATISLSDASGTVYNASVTIVFDSPLNLSAESLNLTAELVDPSSLTSRLPGGITIDPAFPMMITVEPPDFGWIFTSGFELDESGTGDLSFLNSYEIEVHTADLTYTPNSPYRLLKAPVGGAFADVTSDVLAGSTRARGRGGAFSQFVIGSDSQLPLLVATEKLLALDTRLVTAVLGSTLRLDLVDLLAEVNTALLTPLLGCNSALAPLDQFVSDVEANAGTGIANLWRAERDVTNDAGDLESLAATLRFSLVGCAATP